MKWRRLLWTCCYGPAESRAQLKRSMPSRPFESHYSTPLKPPGSHLRQRPALAALVVEHHLRYNKQCIPARQSVLRRQTGSLSLMLALR